MEAATLNLILNHEKELVSELEVLELKVEGLPSKSSCSPGRATGGRGRCLGFRVEIREEIGILL